MSSRRRKSRGIVSSDEMTNQWLDRLAKRRNSLDSFRARANQKRSRIQRIADNLTSRAGSISFLLFHVTLFGVWIFFNLRLVSSIVAFDPIPFGLLTMIMTLEQSLLTIFIIMSQNRSADIADLRNEFDLQINMIAEEEITKALHMLRLIGERLDISEITNDVEAAIMEKDLDHTEIEKQTRCEIDVQQNKARFHTPDTPSEAPRQVNIPKQ